MSWSWTSEMNKGVVIEGRSPSPDPPTSAKLREVLHQAETGGVISPAKLTLAKYLTDWLEGPAAQRVRVKTLHEYAGIVRRHLIPKLGSIPLGKLTPARIQQYHTEALTTGRKDGRGGLNPRTVRNHHRILGRALGHAVRLGLIARNPCRAVSPPTPRPKELKVLDAVGLQKFIRAAEETEYGPMVALAAYSRFV